MRRVILLTLLALALPIAALANIIEPVSTSAGFTLQVGPSLTVGDFSGGTRGCLAQLSSISCSTGNYFNGQNINVGGVRWVLNLKAPTGRIELDITRLTNSTGGNCDLNDTLRPTPCDFIGTVTAFGTAIPNPSHMFTDSISGMLFRGPNQTTLGGNNAFVLSTLTGELGNDAGDLSVSDVQFCRGERAPDCGAPGTNGRLRSGFGVGTLTVVSESVIPEPSTLALLGTGVIGLAGMMRRRCKLGK